MLAVIALWVLAMISGLCWARGYTALLTGAVLLAFAWGERALLGHWTGWLQLAVLSLTPWLLSAQRARDSGAQRQLHAEEAKQLARLSEAARSLLSLQQATQQTEAQIAELADFYHVTKEAGRAMHLRELFEAALEVTPRTLNARGLRLVDLSASPPQVLRAVRTAEGRMRLSTADGILPAEAAQLMAVEELVVQRALSMKQAGSLSVQAAGGLPEGLSRVAWSPLWRPFGSAQGAIPSGVEGWRERQAVGVLMADELDEAQLKMLTILADQVSLQLSRIHLYQQVERLAVTDTLTGLWVRRHFLERAREELDRCRRFGLSCVVLMTDLDHFKQKNDTYGHLVGDVVLRDTARLLQRNLREIDMIARYGGEEFILLMVETPLEQALPIAERLRQLVEVHPIRAYDELLTQTISAGLAAFPRHGQTLEELIERADRALYAAKEAGRNRIVTWSEQLPVRYQPDYRE